MNTRLTMYTHGATILNTARLCRFARRRTASAVVLNQEKAKEMGFIHCEVEDE